MKIPEEVVIEPLEVVVIDDNFEEAFRKFKLLVQKEGILLTYREKQHYEKPSEKKRRKKREAEERKFLAEHREKQVLSGEWDKIQKRKEDKKKQRQQINEQRRLKNNE